jgi:hypothetical protein
VQAGNTRDDQDRAQECVINNKLHPARCSPELGRLAARSVPGPDDIHKLFERMHIISSFITPVFQYAAPDLVGGQDPAIACSMTTNDDVNTTHSELETNSI